jgi:hypothetical protein
MMRCSIASRCGFAVRLTGLGQPHLFRQDGDGPDRLVWNVSGLDGVEVQFDDGHRFRVSSDEPNRLTEALLRENAGRRAPCSRLSRMSLTPDKRRYGDRYCRKIGERCATTA